MKIRKYPARYWNNFNPEEGYNIVPVAKNEMDLFPFCYDYINNLSHTNENLDEINLRSLMDIILHGADAFRVSVLNVSVSNIEKAYSPRYPAFFRNNTSWIHGTVSPSEGLSLNFDQVCEMYDGVSNISTMPVNLAFMLPTLVCTNNAYITSEGQIVKGSYKLNQIGHCEYEKFGELPSNISPQYEKAFVISQNWGSAFYHALAESLPRLAYYYEYLLLHDDIVIVTRSAGFPHILLEFLGFKRDRMTTGAIKAKVVFIPEPSVGCGYPNVMGLLMLQRKVMMVHVSGRVKIP